MRYRYYSNQPSQRSILSRAVNGLDREVEKIFLKMSYSELQPVWKAYGEIFGSGALQYAKRTHHSWGTGAVTMRGAIAERILNLVPLALSHEDRFVLIQKARERFFPKKYKRLRCTHDDWRESIVAATSELISTSTDFKMPESVKEQVVWLAGGDAEAAQNLLAAAEKEEAVMRVRYLNAEFKRIEVLMSSAKLKTVNHTITLPQGNIAVIIHRKKDLYFKLASWFD